MRTYSIYLRNEVRWILKASDPAIIEFPPSSPFDGWALLTPLVVPSNVIGRGLSYVALTSDRFLISSDRIDFRVDTADKDAVWAVAQRILRWLRFITGQPQLGRDIIGHSLQPDADNELVPLPTEFQKLADPVRHVEFSALSFDLMRAAIRSNPSFLVPIYSEVLLDAIESSFVSDERKAILYSAISVEVMAATRIQEIFEGASSIGNTDFRVIRIPQAGGIALEKDPVFDELRRNSERNFKLLLSALPLYVQRRSMLTEDQELYKELVLLHTTRNNLVHSANLERGECIPLNHVGMRRAVDAAIAAFRWFGAAGRYVTMWSTELDADWRTG